MPGWVMGKIMDALNHQQQSIRGSRILILGIAYKKNVDDLRESPAIRLMSLLQERGADIAYSDTWIPCLAASGDSPHERRSIALTPESIADFDLLLLTTDHDAFDYEQIRQQARLIVDTRGVYRQPYPNVVRA